MKSQQDKRLCDYCDASTALLYCRADSAKLCISCDREVHSTNQLFSKHTRALLCDACDSSPASIFCETEHSVFCHNCDWERHNLSSSNCVHNRRPIEGFSGCPSVSELVGILGFEDLGDKKALFLSEENNVFLQSGLVNDSAFGDDGYSDLFVWQNPAVVSIDDLIISSDWAENLQALGVPPLPKNRNAVCGQHKEEVLQQLRELARSEPDANCENKDHEQVNLLRSSAAGLDRCTGCETDVDPGCEENMLPWLSDNVEAKNQVSQDCRLPRNESAFAPDKQSNMDGSLSHEVEPLYVPTPSISVFPKLGSHEINTQERDSAISRYKQKKKSRRYDKHIRYESRKVRAESRNRIRGRFAKMEH